MFERWYLRRGARYPTEVLGILLRLPHAFFIFGVGIVALYLPMSFGEFAVLAAAAVANQGLYNLFTFRHLRRELEPLTHWLTGERSGEGAAAAWRTAASVPYELLMIWWRGGYPLVTILLWAGAATWVLDQPAWALSVLFAATVVGTVYANTFVFLATERAMQPVIGELTGHLSDETDPRAASLALRRRLLLALPALNLLTGVVVIGLANPNGGVESLAEALALSLAVALSFTFVLSYLLASSVVAPIDRLEQATSRVSGGNLATRVPVAGSDEMGKLTRAFNRMVAGLQERERLREAFGTFVDPELAERVARDGTDLRGEEVDMSVLFMDVRGFTSFAENADAAAVVARLNALYEEVVPVVLRHGGHANKFVGDGLMAIFGAPERHPDHADRALAAATEIAACVRERFADELRVGVGVNSGRAVVGTVGGGGRLDFTVIGDTVNTAARVESATRETGDDVLITEATRQRLTAEHVPITERQSLPLKGKSETVRLYAPEGAPAARR